MKNRLSFLLWVAGLVSLTGPALHGGELVNRYWPMHDGDYREYDGRLGPTTNLLLGATAFNRDLFVMLDSSANGVSFYNYSDTGNELLQFGLGTMSNITVILDPPLAIFDENLLLKGGVKKLKMTVRLASTNLPVTATITVTKIKTVQVPAGTFENCLSVSNRWDVTQPGRPALLLHQFQDILAPGVGIIKSAVYNASYKLDGWQELTGGTVGGRDVRLIELTPPTVVITSPSPNTRTTNSEVMVQGTAGDNRGVTEVWSQVNDQAWALATGTTNWQALAVLQPGTNRFQVYAKDAAGNVSPTNLLTLVYVVYDQPLFQISGSGKISPDLRGQSVEIGQAYTLRAVPDKDWVFASWSGTTNGSNASLTFLMQSNLTLTATFVPNPFPAFKGNYSGLFYPTNESSLVQTNNSGGATLALTDQGQFSGKLLIEGASLSFAGQFNGLRSATLSVARPKRSPLSLTFLLSNGAISGQVTDGSWDSALLALRASSLKTNPLAGNYTMLISPIDPNTNSPPGDGANTVSVGANGSIKLAGTLADGVVISQSATVSEEGYWPMYISLYRGQGHLLGWLNVAKGSSRDVDGVVLEEPSLGSLQWIKPAVPKDRYYPAGFRENRNATLATYLAPPPKSNAVEWIYGSLILGGNHLPRIYTNRVIVTNNQFRITHTNLSNLAITLTPKNGAFSGSFRHPVTGTATTFKGVILQRAMLEAGQAPFSIGGGWFQGSNQCGFVRLLPAAPPTPEDDRGRLVAWNLVQAIRQSDLAAVFKQQGVLLTPRYSVNVYRIIYETVDPFHQGIQASGALVVPQNPRRSLPLLSYQHGTIILTNAVPSRMKGEASAGIGLASMGYVCAMPDYLGLGDSPGFHPYLHAKTEATAVVDLLRAAQVFCASRSVALDEQLFLCGYSQGGHATMAAHREIETYHAGEFTVTASAPMAGPYDLSGVTADDFLSQRTMPNPYYFPYLLAAYRMVYPSVGSWSEMLTPQYALVLPPLFNGRNDGDVINEVMPLIPLEILNADYSQAFQNQAQHPLRVALQDNDVFAWTPKAPMHLYHCLGDRDVIYANSERAYAYFQQNGATQVELIDPYPAGDHGTGFMPCILAAQAWFDTFTP